MGFTINYEKSVLTPAHSIKFLGFIIDSTAMTIRPTSEKLSKFKDMAQSLLNNEIPTVYNFASFIGFIVSNFPAVKYGVDKEWEKFRDIVIECTNDVCGGMRRVGGQRKGGVNGGMKKWVGRWLKREELLRNVFRDECYL